MKADIRRWKDLAEMEDPSGLVVLYDGGWCTVRSVSSNISRDVRNRAKYVATMRAPWGDFITPVVKGDHMVAVQEKEGT